MSPIPHCHLVPFPQQSMFSFTFPHRSSFDNVGLMLGPNCVIATASMKSVQLLVEVVVADVAEDQEEAEETLIGNVNVIPEIVN